MERDKRLGEIPPKKDPTDPFEITIMPDRETLQDYLRGSSDHPTVIFNLQLGVFERTRPSPRARSNIVRDKLNEIMPDIRKEIT